MNRWKAILVCAIGFGLTICATSRAEDLTETVTATGHAQAPQKPEILRLTIAVSAQGTDIHEAVVKLKKQRDDLKSRLLAAGATASSISFSDPVEGGSDSALTAQQKMMRQIQMMSRNGRGATSQPSGVTISSTLTAEWALADAPTPDDALVAANELETRIKAALPKSAGGAAKTPEEEEVAAEMAAQTGDTGQKPDEPKLVFIHKMTDEDRAKLLAQAFADAEAQANRIATAGGRHLGPVSHLAAGAGETSNPNSYISMIMEASTGVSSTPPNDNEASGDQRNTVTASTSLTATFRLQ